uniref:Late embryogenesis abundant n=1 Tax=Cleistogenes songorica TaxID=121774 RepID=A0A2S1WLT2_9POAL|nr:late embryogenesis abundant [Cleistogenes songorica]
MSKEQQQARRQPEPEAQHGRGGGGAVHYGDVFDMGGSLAGKPVAPEVAAMTQAAEAAVLGRTPRGGAAAAMQSAAARNARLGVVGSEEATDAAAEQGVAVSESRVPGGRVVTEFVADQPVRQYFDDDHTTGGASAGGRVVDGTKITIGEALEATAFSAGDQPDATARLGADKDVEREDAARVVAAEVRSEPDATARPGGVAASVAAAARLNRGRQ